MSSNNLVEIDGSLLEGGGQILRISIALSALCGVPVRINNIRAGRSKPGLAAQHLKGVKLVGEICQAQIKGDVIGSTEIEFWPKCINGGYFTADTQTAGSIALLLQVALPCTYFANTETTLRLKGGTNAEMAPQIDYITEVFRPILEKFNTSFDFDLNKRGYFPKGGGEVVINSVPIKNLQPVTLLDQGNIKSFYGWSFVAGILPIQMAHKMADSAVKIFQQAYPSIRIDIERYKETPNMAFGNCSGIILVAETTTGCILGSSGLGRKNITPEQVGSTAAEELVQTLKTGACVDKWSQDQIIIFMALANGESQVKIDKMTLHTETAIFVAEKLIKTKFDVINNGDHSIIKCKGIALENKNL